MYESDIKLDKYGNSMVKNGDFDLTVDESDYMYWMLITNPGSWKLYTDLGVGLGEFIGRTDIDQVMKDMKFKIKDFFTKAGYFPNITIYALDDTTLVSNMEFYSLVAEQPVDMTFSFNLENGVIKVPEISIEEQPVNTRSTVNKYLRRK